MLPARPGTVALYAVVLSDAKHAPTVVNTAGDILKIVERGEVLVKVPIEGWGADGYPLVAEGKQLVSAALPRFGRYLGVRTPDTNDVPPCVLIAIEVLRHGRAGAEHVKRGIELLHQNQMVLIGQCGVPHLIGALL